MSTTIATRPQVGEHHAYYRGYVDLVPDGDILEQLALQIADSLAFLSDVDEQRSMFRYAPGKWSIKEVVGHLMDSERIFGYRALRIARGDTTPLEGFDQEALIKGAHFDARPWDELLREWRIVRDANLTMYRGFSEEEMVRMGHANGSDISVRAFAWIMAGHELHHMRIVRERYLNG